MIILGLTGSIGMGKTTTSSMFSEQGVPVNSADDVVHDLYRGEAVPAIEKAFPGVSQGGVIDREKLAQLLLVDPSGYRRLEEIIHPMVRRRESIFLAAHRDAGTDIVLLDIPLLFETGGEARTDLVVVVSCNAEIQRARVMARPGMTEEKFMSILSRQMPDEEKRARADFIIDTGMGLDAARRQVHDIIGKVRARISGERSDA